MVDKGQFFSWPSTLGKNRIESYVLLTTKNQPGIYDPRGAEMFIISLVTLLILMF